MSAQLSASDERLSRVVTAVEAVGGPEGICEAALMRTEFQKTQDDQGFDSCRMVTTLYLDQLNQELASFAINALKDLAEKEEGFGLERSGVDGGKMNQMMFVKDLHENYLNNQSLQDSAVTTITQKFVEPMSQLQKEMELQLTNPGFPVAKTIDGKSENKKGIFQRILDKALSKDKESVVDSGMSF